MAKSDELLALVKSAKEFEAQKKLKEAKHGFLDAATLALQVSKSSSKSEKISYEIIARELIKYAKELQLEILLESQALPMPPGTIAGEKQKVKPKKIEIPRKISEIKIFQLMVVKAGGTPLISYEFEELPENTQLKLNEILFTGAITAVSNLMQEVMEKAIQTIRFEGGVLMIHNEKKLQFILFAKEEEEVLFKYLKKFANDFCAIFRDEINNAARTGMTIPVDEKFEKLATGIFKIKMAEEP
ncbi:MAG: hypothetical protein GPJ54_04640 [Candidatus Heimdallarchaeota archaeon]|nr:hypothetical protein [Candidatus Heimdallarchaeota archaeon]